MWRGLMLTSSGRKLYLRFSCVGKRRGVIFCSYTGKWKDELEKRLETDERVTLLAIGRNRYKLLAYVRKREDMEIVKLETRYMKNRDKGLGLKVTVRRLDEHKSLW